MSFRPPVPTLKPLFSAEIHVAEALELALHPQVGVELFLSQEVLLKVNALEAQ